MSDKTNNKTIHQRLMNFQSKIESIKKDSTNPHFKSKYASLTAIQEAIKQPLLESGLFYTQIPTLESIKTQIFDEIGSMIECEYPINNQLDPQKLGSAITYAKRYSLTSILALATDDDDDGNTAVKAVPANQAQVDWVKTQPHLITNIKESKKLKTKQGVISFTDEQINQL